MRILQIGPAGKNYRTEYYIRKAFIRTGHTVFWFNPLRFGKLPFGQTDRLLRTFCRYIHPDFILITKGNYLDPGIVGELASRYRCAMWFFDAPVEVPQRVLALAKAAGNLFLTSTGQIEWYRSNGIRNVRFLPQACDSVVHHEIPGPLLFDISFIGNAGISAYRHEFLCKAAERFQVHVWGLQNKGEMAPLITHCKRIVNTGLAKVIGSTKIILGLNSYNAMNAVYHSTSNRIWLTLGCAGFFIGYRTPGITDLVPEGKYAEFFENADELFDKIEYYSNHQEQRDRIRKDGYTWAHAHHTYENRIQNLLDLRGFYD